MGTELYHDLFPWGFCPFGDGMNVHSVAPRDRTGHYVLVDFFTLRSDSDKKGVHMFEKSRKNELSSIFVILSVPLNSHLNLKLILHHAHLWKPMKRDPSINPGSVNRAYKSDFTKRILLPMTF